MPPSLQHDAAFGDLVAGVDEAGRGPWAGPVVAAAVIFKQTPDLAGLDDSKKLKPAQREALFDLIFAQACVGVGMASVEEIDRLNILAATKLAMIRAVEGLSMTPNIVLVDGNQPPKLPTRTVAIIGGDGKSLAIAAASVVAKVTRDRIMAELSREYPHYGWEKNAGYGTQKHQDGLAQHGVTPHHRRSYKPIQAWLAHAA